MQCLEMRCLNSHLYSLLIFLCVIEDGLKICSLHAWLCNSHHILVTDTVFLTISWISFSDDRKHHARCITNIHIVDRQENIHREELCRTVFRNCEHDSHILTCLHTVNVRRNPCRLKLLLLHGNNLDLSGKVGILHKQSTLALLEIAHLIECDEKCSYSCSRIKIMSEI